MWCIEVKAKKQIPLGEKGFIEKGKTITITKGMKEKYALWHHSGIWDLPEEYVGEIVRILSTGSFIYPKIT